MTDIKELKRWLDTLAPGNQVAIDAGGLTLVEVTPQGQATGAYLELGGVPEETQES